MEKTITEKEKQPVSGRLLLFITILRGRLLPERNMMKGRENMEPKYIIDTPENQSFLSQNAEQLLTFGKAFLSPYGSAYYLDGCAQPVKDRPRETWITCRMIHVYSMGAMMGKEGCRELAASALQSLLEKGELRDGQNGGFYAGRNADGTIQENKQCYAHAFVILAACSGYLAQIEGAEELLKDALKVYDRYFWEEEKGMSTDTWDTAFSQCDPYRGLNGNMHSVEAFLAAADTLGEEKYRARAGRIIDRVLDWAGQFNDRLPEHFDSEWIPQPELNKDRPDDPFKPYGATCGHGIEWARLIIQWALSTYGKGSRSDEYIKEAARLYDRAVSDGWQADGKRGFVYTTDWNGRSVVTDRMHWTLAEAVNTSAVLHRITGEDKYAAEYAAYMQYLDEKVMDHENGSWYHQLDAEGRPMNNVWPGKPDVYHAFQAMLIPYLPPEISIAKNIQALYRGR